MEEKTLSQLVALTPKGTLKVRTVLLLTEMVHDRYTRARSTN